MRTIWWSLAHDFSDCSWFPLLASPPKFGHLWKFRSPINSDLPTRMRTSVLMLVDHRGHCGLYDPKRTLRATKSPPDVGSRRLGRLSSKTADLRCSFMGLFNGRQRIEAPRDFCLMIPNSIYCFLWLNSRVLRISFFSAYETHRPRTSSPFPFPFPFPSRLPTFSLSFLQHWHLLSPCRPWIPRIRHFPSGLSCNISCQSFCTGRKQLMFSTVLRLVGLYYLWWCRCTTSISTIARSTHLFFGCAALIALGRLLPKLKPFVKAVQLFHLLGEVLHHSLAYDSSLS